MPTFISFDLQSFCYVSDKFCFSHYLPKVIHKLHFYFILSQRVLNSLLRITGKMTFYITKPIGLKYVCFFILVHLDFNSKNVCRTGIPDLELHRHRENK